MQSNTIDNIGLAELFKYLISQLKFLIPVPLVFGIGTALWTLTLPNQYRSEVLLAPVDERASGGLQGMGGQLAGLASIAGVSLDSGGKNEVDIALAVLSSRQFVKSFAQKYNIAVPLLASSKWDPDSKMLEILPSVYDHQQQRWVREVSPPRQQTPTAQEVYDAFMGIVSIEPDQESGMLTIAITFKDPGLAQKWLSGLVNEINFAMRNREVARAKTNVEYLERQIRQTPNVEVKQVFFELIQEQHKSLMLAEVRDDYMFEVVDPPVVPEIKDSPKRAVITIFATLLIGFLLFIFFVIRFLTLSEAASE